MWQDYVLTTVQVFFCLTLIPMLLAEKKPPLMSSIPTGLAIFVSVAVFITLHLWFAAVSSAIVGIQWLALAWQEWSISRA